MLVSIFFNCPLKHMSRYPKIEPIKLKEHTSKQSEYTQCAKLPMRSIVLGPSGSGKTILLQNMILDVYVGCFENIFFFTISSSRSYVVTC